MKNRPFSCPAALAIELTIAATVATGCSSRAPLGGSPCLALEGGYDNRSIEGGALLSEALFGDAALTPAARLVKLAHEADGRLTLQSGRSRVGELVPDRDFHCEDASLVLTRQDSTGFDYRGELGDKRTTSYRFDKTDDGRLRMRAQNPHACPDSRHPRRRPRARDHHGVAALRSCEIGAAG